MISRREYWQRELKAERVSEEDIAEILSDWEGESRPNPEWGNCKRGCRAAYLDNDGFCSPACALGSRRGKFVTPPRERTIEMYLR